VPITTALTFRALDAMPRHGLSFWDALIWAAAAENGLAVLYTEDFQDSRDIEGVLFVNSFRPGSSATP
jgi:predicted nucleic acid-binding protein